MDPKKASELAAFEAFYQETSARLKKKTKKVCRELAREKNPLLQVYRTDLADLNEGGKLLRGMLICLGYRIASGKDPAYADDLALAYELFQTGVLIHDDIIDHADIRRGKMTVQRRVESRMDLQGTRLVATGETRESLASSVALCTGDLGLYYANLLLARQYAKDPAACDLISCFDKIVIDTIRGELLDVILPYELQDARYDEEAKKKLLEKSILDIYHLKTACYSVIGPLRLGMMLGGAKEEDIRKMERFGDEVGIAYQIMDDILGIFADSGYLGKDVGSDIAEYKQTILYLYVRVFAPSYFRELERYYGKQVDSEEVLEAVRRIFKESGALEYALGMMAGNFRRANAKLSRMAFVSEEDKKVLKGFIFYCENRKK